MQLVHSWINMGGVSLAKWRISRPYRGGTPLSTH